MHELVDKFEKIFSQTGITSINKPLESETTSNYSPLLHDIQKSEMKNVTDIIEMSFFVIHLLVVFSVSINQLVNNIVNLNDNVIDDCITNINEIYSDIFEQYDNYQLRIKSSNKLQLSVEYINESKENFNSILEDINSIFKETIYLDEGQTTSLKEEIPGGTSNTVGDLKYLYETACSEHLSLTNLTDESETLINSCKTNSDLIEQMTYYLKLHREALEAIRFAGNSSVEQRLDTISDAMLNNKIEVNETSSFEKVTRAIYDSMYDYYMSDGENTELLEDMYMDWYYELTMSELDKPSGYKELTTLEYLEKVAENNSLPVELYLAIIIKEQITKLPPDAAFIGLNGGISYLNAIAYGTGIDIDYSTGHSMGLGAVNPGTSIMALSETNPALLNDTFNNLGLEYSSNDFNDLKKTSDINNIMSNEDILTYEMALYDNNSLNIESINVTLLYYNTTEEGVGFKRRDGSKDVVSIDVHNWDNLTDEEKYEAIGRYNANKEDPKYNYGSIVVDSLKKVGK